MPSDAEIEARFWKELKASPFMMLGLDGARDGHAQPMTAHFEDDHGPIWFFTSNDNGLVRSLTQSHRAMAHYVAKGHDLFATIHGDLVIDTDPATIERLWNAQVAAWFEGGRNDPKITLLRLETESAQLWLSSSSAMAAVKRLFGADPKREASKNVAEVAL